MGNVTSVSQPELEGGVSSIEAVQAVWGKKGFRIVLFGYVHLDVFL